MNDISNFMLAGTALTQMICHQVQLELPESNKYSIKGIRTEIWPWMNWNAWPNNSSVDGETSNGYQINVAISVKTATNASNDSTFIQEILKELEGMLNRLTLMAMKCHWCTWSAHPREFATCAILRKQIDLSFPQNRIMPVLPIKMEKR